MEDLGLRFDEVSTQLDRLSCAHPDWWALGKLVAYAGQEAPFVHVDSDAYLWSPLPARLVTAPVLAQNSEVFVPGSSYYEPELMEDALDSGGWLPAEWTEVRNRALNGLKAVCCGIVGGVAVEFLRHYATQAIDLVSRPENELALGRLPNRAQHMILVEQFLLWACIEHHAGHPSSKFRDVGIEYLFPTEEQAYAGSSTSAYTHLIGHAKRNPLIASRLESRVRRQFPEVSARIDRLSRQIRVSG